MGAITFSVDRPAVQLLAGELGLSTFVETGTFRGDSIAAVRDLFDRVHSIEIDAGLASSARMRFTGDDGVAIHTGASPCVLHSLHSELRDRIFYWLDAHWCESGGSDPKGQCPLLAELMAIGTVGSSSVIAIDDARLFLAPPTAIHAIADWPHFDDVLSVLRTVAPDHRIVVFNDVIWAVPVAAFAALRGYAARHGVDWLAIAEKARTYDDVMLQLGEKDQEIGALSRENQKRLELISGLNTTLDQLLKERALARPSEDDLASLRAVAEERARLITTLDQLLKERAQARASEDELVALRAVAEERAQLITTLDAAVREAHGTNGGIEEEKRQWVLRNQAIEAAAADLTGQVVAATERANTLEKIANERLAVIERLEGVARAIEHRAQALEELAKSRAEVIGEWQTRAVAAEQQLAEISTTVAGITGRAEAAERECAARLVVIEELVRARDAFSAALAAKSRLTRVGRLLFRSDT